MEQLSFKEAEMMAQQARVKEIGEQLDRLSKESLVMVDRGELAALLDLAYTTVCELVNVNSPKIPKPHHLAAVVVKEPDMFVEQFILPLCDLCGYEAPKKRESLTPEQKLALLESRINQLVPGAAKTILEGL